MTYNICQFRTVSQYNNSAIYKNFCDCILYVCGLLSVTSVILFPFSLVISRNRDYEHCVYDGEIIECNGNRSSCHIDCHKRNKKKTKTKKNKQKNIRGQRNSKKKKKMENKNEQNNFFVSISSSIRPPTDHYFVTKKYIYAIKRWIRWSYYPLLSLPQAEKKKESTEYHKKCQKFTYDWIKLLRIYCK